MNSSTKEEAIASDNQSACTHGEPVAVVADPHTLGVALDKVLPAAMALDRDKLVAVNIDAAMVASVVIAVAAKMAPHRPYFASLPDFDMEAFDLLEVSGNALSLAQSDYRYAITPPDDLTALVERGSELRGTLQHAAEALADGGLLSKQQVTTMRGGTSYRDLGTALSGWPRILLAANWEAIKQRSLLTDAMLTEAGELGMTITGLTGAHDLSPQKIAEKSDIRQRVLTLVMSRYDEVRRGASFMRWHQEDAETFAPSLYSSDLRGNEVRAKDAEARVEEPAIVAAPAPVAKAPEVKPVAAPQSIGLPNSDPFIS